MSKKKKKNKALKKILKWIIKHRVASIIIGVAIIAAIVVGITFAVSANSRNNEPTDEKITTEKQTTKKTNNDGPAISDTDKRETDAPVESPYLVKVNRAMNCITVYQKDSNGEFTDPVIAFPCSTGREDGHETPLGTFSISWKSEWCLMVDGTYGQYTSCFNGDILFHSVPYFGTVAKDKTNLEYEQYNKLGEFASLGCVRLCVADAKWIFDNCPSGTTVIVYDDYSSVGPLGKPAALKMPYTDSTLVNALGANALLKYCGWDPTDPDQNNPWYHFTISSGTVTTTAGSSLAQALSSLSILSPDGASIPSSYLKVAEGSYDLNTAGTYNVKVTFDKDYLPATAEANVTIVVNAGSKPAETEVPTPKPGTSEPPTTTASTNDPTIHVPASGIEIPVQATNDAGYALLFGIDTTPGVIYSDSGAVLCVKSGSIDFTHAGTYENIVVGYSETGTYGNGTVTVTVKVI